MGEAALSYWLDEFINPTPVAADAEALEYVVLIDGESDDDWKYGTDCRITSYNVCYTKLLRLSSRTAPIP